MRISPVRARVEVSRSALLNNFKVLSGWVSPAKIAPVVKSEAYGHGLLEVAKLLEPEELWGCCVVSVEEALALRENGFSKRIVVVGPSFAHEVMDAVAFDIEIALYADEQLKSFAILGNNPIKVHLKVDTGLGRLAYSESGFLSFAEKANYLPQVDIVGLYSHLADAEGLDQSYTHRQFQVFQSVRQKLESMLGRRLECHIAASAAGILLEPLRLDFVRAGIALYGLWPSQETKLLALGRQEDLGQRISQEVDGEPAQKLRTWLEPALSFKSQIAQVKEVEQGQSIGYGCTYQAKRSMKVAIVPVGYAEGVDRRLSNRGDFLVLGCRCPIVGRVCMNMTFLDVTDVPAVQAGDEVVLIGRQGSEEITAEEWADQMGTIHYEVVTCIPREVHRVYVD